MKPAMHNVDRWLIYSRQRRIQAGDHRRNLYGPLVEMTSKQLRRARKKANRNNDDTIGFAQGVSRPAASFYVDETKDHEIDCTCMMCIPGAM